MSECTRIVPDDLELALETRLKRLYEKELEKEEISEQQRRIRAEANHSHVLKEWRTRDEIIEAWGADCITARERNRLLKIWDNVYGTSRERVIYMEWLKKEIRNLAFSIADLKKKMEEAK